MKSRLHLSLNVGTLIAATTTVLCTGAVGAEPTTEKSSAGTAQSKPVPQSTYAVPANAKDGRDPFFPNSDRLNARVIVKATATSAPSVTLILNGIAPGFAMINGRTLAPGEESDVKTDANSTRRVHIRLIEIKDKEKTAVVELEGGERRELSLRPGN